ncbi:MAG TPA: polysaccharide deacetylase family protein [Cytophagaceae bacterium]|jgi:hypothetical protein
MSKILVYTSIVTERLKYAFNLVLNDQLGLEVFYSSNLNEFNAAGDIKINYSLGALENSIHIKPSKLLFERDINEAIPNIGSVADFKVLYKSDTACDLGFDIFAASFYLVSRYEEYLPFTPDRFGRYRAEDSLAYKHDLLKIPSVNIWCEFLKEKLQRYHPKLNFKVRKYEYICTLDIDNAFAYKGKGLVRNLGGLIKDTLAGKVSKIFNRVMALLNLKKDPFDTYDFQEKVIKENNLQSIYFFLLGNYGPFDKNLDHRCQSLRSIIRRCRMFAQVAIHPSFASNSKATNQVETARLVEILEGESVTKSRQHYLKVTFPETYAALITAGIKEDYTLGHASIPGFRAGICTPFFFFNLKTNQVTDLKIFPLSIMEGTLKQYLNLSPDKAIEEYRKIIDEVKKVNGLFISLWHNDSLSDKYEWKGWRRVFFEMVRLAAN